MNAPPPDSAAPLSCCVCGRSSALRRAFIVGKDGAVAKTWCPPCAQIRAIRFHDLSLIVSPVGVLALWSGIRPDSDRVHVCLFLFCLFNLLTVPMTVMHELGHAVAAWFVGYPPIAVVIGSGRMIFRCRLGGLRILVGRMLRGGMTIVDVREERSLRARLVFLTAGGALMNIALGLVAFHALLVPFPRAGSSAWQLVLFALVLVNVFMAIRNLWPRTYLRDGRARSSDGASILAALSGPGLAFSEYRAAVHGVRASFAFVEEDFDAALREARAITAAAHEPDLIASSTVTAAAALSELGRAAEARDLLVPLLARTDVDDAVRAFAEDNLAWAYLLLDEPALLEQGTALSERALALIPWSESIIVTHACLLAASTRPPAERIDQAKRLLASLAAFKLNRQCRAYAALAQGLVAAAEGDLANATLAYQQAKTLRATAAPLRVLQRRLASP